MGHVGDFQVRVHSNNMAERVLCVLHHPLRHSRVGRIRRTGAHWGALGRMRTQGNEVRRNQLPKPASRTQPIYEAASGTQPTLPMLRPGTQRPSPCCILGRKDARLGLPWWIPVKYSRSERVPVQYSRSQWVPVQYSSA